MNYAQQYAKQILATPLIDQPEVLAIAQQGILDFFACNLRAKQESEVADLIQWAKQEGGKPTSWLIGHKMCLNARQTALILGLQTHLLDYDDAHEKVRGHPSAVILSALFASIDFHQKAPISSLRFLSAYIIGVEFMARLGDLLNPQHYLNGWHSTATLGGFGAVAAICYLHQYDFLAEAFALISTQSSGLRITFGTSVKPLNAGIAAQNAIQTIAWLKNGIKAQFDCFYPELGFLATQGKKAMTLELSNWGENWQITQLWFKTYYYCSAAANIADATYQLRQNNSIQAEDIEQLELIFAPKSDAALIYTRPLIEKQGRFSAEYIVAKILYHEPLDCDAFSERPIAPHIAQLMEKMTRSYQHDPQNERFAQLKPRSKNQTFLSPRINYPQGSPKNPYSKEQHYHKLATAIQNPKLSQALQQAIDAFSQDSDMIQFIQTYFHQL